MDPCIQIYPTSIVTSYVTPKAGRVSLILINTTRRNIWIRQPLLASDIYEVKLHPWQYSTNLTQERNDIKLSFQLVVPPEVENNLQSYQVEPEIKAEISDDQETPHQTFEPYPDTSSNYNFDDEVEGLLFKFNTGDVLLNKEQHNWLLNLIYDNKDVFSLHDKDVGFCDKLANTIPPATDKPVDLPYRTILNRSIVQPWVPPLAS